METFSGAVHTPLNDQMRVFEADALDSFDLLLVDSSANKEQAESGLSESIIPSAGTSSSTTTVAIPVSVPQAPPPVPSVTTALVPRAVAHTFSGHDGTWLNAEELSKVLGRQVGSMDRPSMLNALAFKCGGKDCAERQCTASSERRRRRS